MNDIFKTILNVVLQLPFFFQDNYTHSHVNQQFRIPGQASLRVTESLVSTPEADRGRLHNEIRTLMKQCHKHPVIANMATGRTGQQACSRVIYWRSRQVVPATGALISLQFRDESAVEQNYSCSKDSLCDATHMINETAVYKFKISCSKRLIDHIELSFFSSCC